MVVVGDCPLDERLAAVLHAAREALVNAAKYAAGAPISVYAEVEPEQVTVFVRDRGPGFDLDAVPEDRLGLRQSVVGRMAAPRRPGDSAVGARRGHRGAARDAARSRTRQEHHMTDDGATAQPAASVPAGPVRVVLVDDHRMFRSGVRAELGDAVEVVGEAEDVDQAVAVIRGDAAGRGAARRAPARWRWSRGAGTP